MYTRIGYAVEESERFIEGTGEKEKPVTRGVDCRFDRDTVKARHSHDSYEVPRADVVEATPGNEPGRH